MDKITAQIYDLEPERVFYHFKKISEIPRSSGNERAVSDYIEGFARGRSLSVYRDERNNLIVKKDAPPEYKNKSAVILQGHLDMVCEKNVSCKHDFNRDPLDIFVCDDFIRARGTTLGADNGIALAFMLALLEGDYIHPPLETVFTADEETGMGGAAFLDASLLSGRRMINLDEGREGCFIVSCAGGVKSTVHIPLDFGGVPDGMEAASLSVKGLKGGHSGTEIDKNRANANILLGRALRRIRAGFDVKLYHLTGGLKDNAIPREAFAAFYINGADYEKILKCVREAESEIKKEYKASDGNIEISFSRDECPRISAKAVSDKCFDRIISSLALVPDGALSRASDTGIVETSNNAGVMRMDAGEFTLQSAVRSSVISRKMYVHEKIKCLAALSGGYETASGSYPEWEYEDSSQMRELCVKVYTGLYGRAPSVTGIHAGLECGIFAEKIKGIDMIAFGPDILGAHTPDEALSVSSVQRTWKLLLKALEELAAASPV